MCRWKSIHHPFFIKTKPGSNCIGTGHGNRNFLDKEVTPTSPVTEQTQKIRNFPDDSNDVLYLCQILTEPHLTLLGRPFSLEGHWDILNPWVRGKKQRLNQCYQQVLGCLAGVTKAWRTKGSHISSTCTSRILKKFRLEERHRLAGTPFGPPRTQEYLGQAPTSRNSTNDDVKSCSPSRLKRSSTQRPKKEPNTTHPKGIRESCRACPDKPITLSR